METSLLPHIWKTTVATACNLVARPARSLLAQTRHPLPLPQPAVSYTNHLSIFDPSSPPATASTPPSFSSSLPYQMPFQNPQSICKYHYPAPNSFRTTLITPIASLVPHPLLNPN